MSTASASIPSRLIVLTGATGSIGSSIALSLASATPQSSLLLTARNATAAEKLVSSLRAQSKNPHVFYELVDLSSKKSVRAFADTVGSKYGGKVNVLVNNAAITADERKHTADGLELQFQVNVLSYYMLANLLRPYLKAASTASNQSRIVNVASNYAGDLDLNDLQFMRRTYTTNAAYRQSKQANRMLTYALAPAFAKDGITVNACHPGVVTSNLLQGLGMSRGYDSKDQGAATPVFLATAAEVEGKTGGFYDGKRERSCQFKSDKLAIEQLAHTLENLSH